MARRRFNVSGGDDDADDLVISSPRTELPSCRVQDSTVEFNFNGHETISPDDLSFLRDALKAALTTKGKKRPKSVVLDLSPVAFCASGFFGILGDWHDEGGLKVIIANPSPRICQTTWFQNCFQPVPGAASRFEYV